MQKLLLTLKIQGAQDEGKIRTYFQLLYFFYNNGIIKVSNVKVVDIDFFI